MSETTSKGPSALSLWLEEALSGWILPVAAIAVVVIVGLLYVAGLASEAATGALVVLVAPLVTVAVMLRPALDASRRAGERALLGAAAVATLALSVGPALQTILPGAPMFRGDVGIEGEGIAVPAGVSGPARILVSGRLKEGGEPSVSFTLTGTRDPIEGKLERTYGYARVGRMGRARVSHDHTSDWYEGQIPPGTPELKLDRLQGQLGGRIQVAAYREWLSHGTVWLLSVLALLVAAAADARLGQRGNAAVAAGMALAFGLLVAYNATPSNAVGPAVGGIVLGAIIGAVVGALVGAIARKAVPAARRRPVRAGKGNGAAAA